MYMSKRYGLSGRKYRATIPSLLIMLTLLAGECHAFTFTTCREAQNVAAAPNPPTGAVTRGFIRCFDELLGAMDTLAQEANRGRDAVFAPSLELYRAIKGDTMVLLYSMPDPTTPEEIQQVQDLDKLIAGSRILDEVVAFEPIMNAPTYLVPVTEKQDKGEKITNSVKDIIKKVNEWWAPQWFKDLVKALLDAIDEVLGVLRGKGK